LAYAAGQALAGDDGLAAALDEPDSASRK